jgi:hypothetical protein
MGGLIALFLFLLALAIGVYYLVRKLTTGKEVPADVAGDDLIGGALNLAVMLGSLILFVFALRPFFMQTELIPGANGTVRGFLLFGVALGCSYLVLLVVNHVFTGGHKT